MLWCCSIPYARAMLLAAEAHHLLFELCVMVSGLASVCDVASEPSFRFGSVSTLHARSCVLRTKVYSTRGVGRCTRGVGRCTRGVREVYEWCTEVYGGATRGVREVYVGVRERCTEVYAEVYERCTQRCTRGVREVYERCTAVRRCTRGRKKAKMR